MMKMAVFAKDGLEVRDLLRTKPPIVKPHESICKIKIRQKEAQKCNQDICNQEQKVNWENNAIKFRDRGVLCNNIPRDM